MEEKVSGGHGRELPDGSDPHAEDAAGFTLRSASKPKRAKGRYRVLPRWRRKFIHATPAPARAAAPTATRTPARALATKW